MTSEMKTTTKNIIKEDILKNNDGLKKLRQPQKGNHPKNLDDFISKDDLKIEFDSELKTRHGKSFNPSADTFCQ